MLPDFLKANLEKAEAKKAWTAGCFGWPACVCVCLFLCDAVIPCVTMSITLWGVCIFLTPPAVSPESSHEDLLQN